MKTKTELEAIKKKLLIHFHPKEKEETDFENINNIDDYMENICGYKRLNMLDVIIFLGKTEGVDVELYPDEIKKTCIRVNPENSFSFDLELEKSLNEQTDKNIKRLNSVTSLCI